MAHDRYSKDLEEIKKRGVQVIKTPDAVLQAQLAGLDKVRWKRTKDPFFQKVVELQKAWVKRDRARYFSSTTCNASDL